MKLFDRLLGKRKKVVPIESDKPRNEYYENISARFGIAQVVLYLLLFSFSPFLSSRCMYILLTKKRKRKPEILLDIS